MWRFACPRSRPRARAATGIRRVFSARLQADLRPNPLTVLLEEKRRAGSEILDLTESNPTRAGLRYPEAEILEALGDARAMRYDPAPAGMRSAREAVAAYYADRGESVRVEDILLTSSTSEAYALLFKLLCDPGDEVLVPRPSYPLFDYLAAMESVVVRQYALRYDARWAIDFDALEKEIGPRTRAIVAVHPNNPTGSFVKRDERARLDAICARRGIALLSDEVFLDYGNDPGEARAGTLAVGGEALTFAMSGLSKVAALPQMKLGWIVAGGERKREALERLEWIADTYLSVGAPVQCAAPRLLALRGAMQGEIRRRIDANRTGLLGALGSDSPARALFMEGGWYTVIEVPRTSSEEEWTLELLREHNTLVQPGYFFDFEREAFLVLSLLTSERTFAEGLHHLRRMLREPD